MSPVARLVLAIIGRETGAGDTALGFDLFDHPQLHRLADIPVERLHRTYNYEAAVCYLAQLLPQDARALEDETGVAIKE